jgi:hypothetical protein
LLSSLSLHACFSCHWHLFFLASVFWHIFAFICFSSFDTFPLSLLSLHRFSLTYLSLHILFIADPSIFSQCFSLDISFLWHPSDAKKNTVTQPWAHRSRNTRNKP